jgi:large conductance mechanosensitive channel
MSMLDEFKDFAMKGNVMDLAIGVIIGGAFGKIVTSLVDNVLMPIIGSIGNVDFTGLMTKLGTDDKSPMLKYGSFMQSIVDFLLIAACLFLLVKALNSMKKPAPAAAPAAPPAQETYLKEIRDLLAKR